MPFFMLTAFFILEIGVAMFQIATCEKAVQLGARVALVTDPAATGVPTLNTRVGGNYGDQCSTGACTDFGTLTCTGGGGCPASFATIANRMRNIFNVADQYITITYTYVGLGFAGGPSI